jgi:hypothetical protein
LTAFFGFWVKYNLQKNQRLFLKHAAVSKPIGDDWRSGSIRKPLLVSMGLPDFLPQPPAAAVAKANPALYVLESLLGQFL